MNHKSEPWIQTFTGKKFHFDSLNLNEFDIEDIAHALSMQCRYAGHSKFFYSVAQHSYMASFLAPNSLRLAVLLHDAAEAYLGDVIKPLKIYLGGKYSHLEYNIQQRIDYKFGLLPMNSIDCLEIKQADIQMLKLEANSILNNPPIENWHDELPDQKIFNSINEGWSWEYAKMCFLDRFNDLFKE